MNNKEKLIMYLICFMWFSIFIVSDNLELINKLLFTYKLDLISVIIFCLSIGVILFIVYLGKTNPKCILNVYRKYIF